MEGKISKWEPSCGIKSCKDYRDCAYIGNEDRCDIVKDIKRIIDDVCVKCKKPYSYLDTEDDDNGYNYFLG